MKRKKTTTTERSNPRPIARADVDDFADGPRERGSKRGGFISEHSDTNPGGTTGEHSGQRQDSPRKH